MKTKNVSTGKMLLTAIMALTASSELLAQQNNINNGGALWKPIGKDTVSTNKVVLINNNLNVEGNVTADTIHATNVIKVGTGTLYISGTQTGPSSATDQITVSSGQLTFGNNIAPFSNIQVGIGTTTTIAGVGLNVFDDVNVALNDNILCDLNYFL